MKTKYINKIFKKCFKIYMKKMLLKIMKDYK